MKGQEGFVGSIVKTAGVGSDGAGTPLEGVPSPPVAGEEDSPDRFKSFFRGHIIDWPFFRCMRMGKLPDAEIAPEHRLTG